MNSIVIGFTGGTGSGKTTLAQRLNEVFKNNSVIIKQDSYYKDFPDKTFEERVQINYDHPDSFDMERFTDDVRRLKAGETIECLSITTPSTSAIRTPSRWNQKE